MIQASCRRERLSFGILEHCPPDAAHSFRTALLMAKHSRGGHGACLHAYETHEYAKMRLFLGSCGQYGFALNDGCIVSLFSQQRLRGKRLAHHLLHRATDEGGTHLDAFETRLRVLYEEAGFVVVARTPFSDEHRPADWCAQAFAQYNGGRPDVVFMLSRSVLLRDPEPVRVCSYEDGIAVQRNFLRLREVYA